MRACGWPGCRKGECLGIKAHMSDAMAVSRRLVAVFAADVEGYSRLMGADEVGTLRGLTERRAILDRLIAENRGRISNTAGDSVLAEFGSAVDAVQCAVEAQTALAEANAARALTIDPIHDAYLALGYMRLFQRRHDDALGAGEKAIALCPNGAVDFTWQ